MPYQSLQSIPKKPEAFCACRTLEQPADSFNNKSACKIACSCGEESNMHEWVWDSTVASVSTRLSMNDREVQFHPTYSNGTAAIRGNMPCVNNNDYYWEIKILSPVYGTDVMIGVGTKETNLHGATYNFCSLLGSDEESWGYSYRGAVQHKGKKELYGLPFGFGSIVGVHLDMWKGTLQYYLNRRPLGVAFTSLRDRILYPMVCSTTARTSMRVTHSASSSSSLQLLCLKKLGSNPRLAKTLRSIPFFRQCIDKQYWWLIRSENGDAESDEGSSTDSDMLDEEIDDVNLMMCMDMITESSGDCASVEAKKKHKKKRKKVILQSLNQNPKIIHTCHGSKDRNLCNYCDIIL